MSIADKESIQVPGSVARLIESRVASGEFVDASEYLTWLVENDCNNKLVATPELERLLNESLSSGPSIVPDDAFWEERRRRLREYVANKESR